MTQLLQSGHHPDADQLSAFAEHALPAHEQQQTLAHLATCADCRAIVFLAQPDQVEAQLPQPTAARRPWFSGWNLAIPAALALAALALVTIHLRNVSTNRQQAESNTTAHMEQPATPLQAAPATAPTAPSKPIPAPIEELQTTPAPLAAPMPTRPMLAPRPAEFGVYTSTAGRASSPPLQLNPVAGSGAALGAQPGPTVSGGLSMNGPPRPEAPKQVTLGNAGLPNRELHSSAAQYNSAATAAQTSLNQNYVGALPPPPPAAPPANVNQTVAVTGDSAALDTAAASSQLIENETYANLPLKAQKQPSLPSHLTAVSTIANARQELAIDSAGSLFRSQDAGVTWQPIPAQWTGRATKLQLAPSPATHTLAKSASSPAAMSAAKAAPASPQATFELTTDAGEVWTSTDGQTWKHK
jgi:Putative zinc-finger